MAVVDQNSMPTSSLWKPLPWGWRQFHLGRGSPSFSGPPFWGGRVSFMEPEPLKNLKTRRLWAEPSTLSSPIAFAARFGNVLHCGIITYSPVTIWLIHIWSAQTLSSEDSPLGLRSSFVGWRKGALEGHWVLTLLPCLAPLSYETFVGVLWPQSIFFIVDYKRFIPKWYVCIFHHHIWPFLSLLC